MNSRKERNSQIRMSSSLWNLVGEIAQDLGIKDLRGRHSTVIREMIAAAAAKWTHSPYVCRSSCHTVYVTKVGCIFSRHVEALRLNARRERLPCVVEMKPEKRDYFHRKYRELKRLGEVSEDVDEFKWFNDQWLVNHFAVWSGRKESDEIELFDQPPLSSHVDTFGPTYKSADLAVHALGGRFLTREITVGLRDYVQWKESNTRTFDPVFDRFDIPIDIPTSNLEVCVVVDLELFASMDISEDEISNLALEFRNRESARFEGKEVALYPETTIEEQYGRSLIDEGADEMLRKIRKLRQRINAILDSSTSEGVRVSDYSDKAAITASLSLPRQFLFYWLRWPSPHFGIEACVRWEKPVRPTQSPSSDEDQATGPSPQLKRQLRRKEP